jgi:CheY-like chemotaxis protein
MIKNEPLVNILLVDDKPANLLALEAVLESMGLNLMKANSGEEALQKLTLEDFAVVLMDVRMPEMDGFETAATIRRRDPSCKTPIIFLTAAQENEADVIRAYEVGAIDYLLKPFVPSVLQTKVAVLIDLYRKNEGLRQLVDKLDRRIGELVTENSILKKELNK